MNQGCPCLLRMSTWVPLCSTKCLGGSWLRPRRVVGQARQGDNWRTMGEDQDHDGPDQHRALLAAGWSGRLGARRARATRRGLW
jgi:hypothetical protein